MVVRLSDDVVEVPEDGNTVPDMSMVAMLPEAGEEVVEVLQPVLQGLVEPLDEVLSLDGVEMMLQPEESVRFRVPDPFVRPEGLGVYH